MTEPTDPAKPLTLEAAAALFGCSVRHLKSIRAAMIGAGIPCGYKIGRRVEFEEKDLAAIREWQRWKAVDRAVSHVTPEPGSRKRRHLDYSDAPPWRQPK